MVDFSVWKLKDKTNKCFDAYDVCMITPYNDLVWIPISNQKGNRHLQLILKTDEAKAFAEYLLKACEKNTKIQKIRKKSQPPESK